MDYKCSFYDNFVKLEKPKEGYDNIVRLEKKKWKTKWLNLEVKRDSLTYYVYLTEEMFDRVRDGYVYFDKRENLP